MDRLIARKIAADPLLMDRARKTLSAWLQSTSTPVPAWLEWKIILSAWPQERILALLVSDSPEATRLRQSSPFCGILTPGERLAILKDYESRAA